MDETLDAIFSVKLPSKTKEAFKAKAKASRSTAPIIARELFQLYNQGEFDYLFNKIKS